MSMKLLIIAMSITSSHHLYAAIQSPNKQTNISYISYNLLETKKNIFQNLTVDRQWDRCHNTNNKSNTPPIGCIKIKIKNGIDMI